MKGPRKRVPLAVALALMLALAPLAAAQTDAAPEVQDGLARLLRYAGCALSIVAAPSGIGVAAATVLCLVLVVDETH